MDPNITKIPSDSFESKKAPRLGRASEEPRDCAGVILPSYSPQTTVHSKQLAAGSSSLLPHGHLPPSRRRRRHIVLFRHLPPSSPLPVLTTPFASSQPYPLPLWRIDLLCMYATACCTDACEVHSQGGGHSRWSARPTQTLKKVRARPL
jgi:hypothetical protein